MTILTGSDGTQTVVNHDVDEPCYACPCCALWASTVETLRASMLEHEQAEHAGWVHAIGCARPGDLKAVRARTFPGCLVCQLLAGVVDVSTFTADDPYSGN